MSIASFGDLLLDDGHDAPEDTPRLAGRFGGNHILVPLLTRSVPTVTDQITVASTLARATDATLTVVDPTSAPGRTLRTFGRDVIGDDDAAVLEWVLEHADATDRAEGGFRYTRDVAAGVLRTVGEHDVDTLVLPSESRGGRLRKGITERIAARASCDVVVVNGQAGYEDVASVLLPIAGGPHSGLAADFARSIAADCNAWVDVLHVVEEDPSERQRARATALVEDASRRIARPETTTTWVLEADDVAEAIIEQSRYYGLTVIGAPTKGRLREFIHGSTTRSVRASARSVVLMARNNGSRSLHVDQQ